ncbi:MAG: AMP-binding protein, partial [Myxococcota bacterium]
AMAALSAPESQQRDALMKVSGGRLKFCLSGGAGLKKEIKDFFFEHDILIIEGYGLTECSPTLTLNRPDDFDFTTVGKPLPSVELKLADDGEILAKGPNVFAGYHKDPKSTADAFTDDGWFKTGDVGVFTDGGFLRIVDRKKDIIVTSGGKNIPPANIELRFADEPLVDHVVVYGDAKKYLVAGLWPSTAAESLADAEAELSQCIERINSQHARVETIKKFFVSDSPLTVENGLLTPSLKVKRKKVYEAFRERFESLYE